MLKNLLHELGKSLRREPVSVPADPLEGWKAAFRGAAAPQRAALVAQLDAWISEHPERKQGWILRGDWRLRSGDLSGAEQDYRRALQLDPISPSTQEGLGLTLLQAGRLDDAYLHLETAHKLEPMNADVLNHWGLVALEMGNLGDARAKFERAVERDIRNSHACHNLGLVAIRQGQIDKGIEHFLRAIQLKPDFAVAHRNLSQAYRDAERIDDSIAAARRAAELRPEQASSWIVLGDALVNAGRFDEAETALDRACELAPDSVDAQVGLGKLFTALRRTAAGEQAYQQALTLSPGHAEAEHGLALLELLAGRYPSGWRHYEARRRLRNTPIRTFPYVEWDGAPLRDHTVLVHAEQGLGDLILFAAYLPFVIAEAKHVVIETYPRLASLFARSFPDATVVGRDVTQSDASWLEKLPPVDRQIAAGSLPRHLHGRLESAHRTSGYLTPDPARVEAFRSRLDALGPEAKVGIAWRGGLVRSAGRQRSIELVPLLKALSGLNVHLVSLQYGDVGDEVEQAQLAVGARLHHWPDALVDQDDAAALTRSLDAVVTVCQTQAHLTGAIGHDGCILVPANPNWRYGASGNRVPWYPTLHLIRQQQAGSWDAPLAEAAAWVMTKLPGSR